jgi:hypothetical protein
MNRTQYRSFRWWLVALYMQTRHLVRNIFLRKWLKIEMSKTLPDRLLEGMSECKTEVYSVLVSKHPEYLWTEKYVRRNSTYMIPEFCLLYCHLKYSLAAFWCKEADLEHCLFILSMGIPFTTTINLKDGTPHAITLIGYDLAREIFFAHDPLGDHFSDYKIVYGANLEFSFNYLKEINRGKSFGIYCNLLKQEHNISSVKDKFNGLNYYIFE